jgi:flagellar secretion chaperone FliS
MTLALQIRPAAPNSTLATHQGATAADPYGLTRMLMDGALERLEAARERDRDGAPVEAGGPLDSVRVLIGELRAGLDLQSGGVIAANIDDLYDYMGRRLNAAELGSSEKVASGPFSDIGFIAGRQRRDFGDLGSATVPIREAAGNGLPALHEVSHLLAALRSAWAFMPAEVRAGSRN